MEKKKSIGGIVPLTPTERELEGWNFLFDDYLFMDPIKDKGQEPGRMCYCTHCRKVYRVNEWARVISYEEREIITAKHANRVKCAKCGTVFADAYREHLWNHFEAMKNKKERTTA